MADETPTIGDVLSDGRYRIPDYQRGYDWDSKHVRDFMYDLRRVVLNNAGEGEDIDHYFGTIVRVERDDEGLSDHINRYEVLDGQQRLTTASLAIGHITRKILDLAPEGTAKDLVKVVRGARKHHIVDEEGDDWNSNYSESEKWTSNNLGRHFRFLPAETHRRVFCESILGNEELEPSNPSSENIRKAYKRIEEHVDSICESITPPEHISDDAPKELKKAYKLDLILSQLVESFVVTTYTVEEPEDAGMFFQAVNDRGKDLTTAHKIKSYLVHITSRDDVDVSAENIHETFTEVKEFLHDLDGSVEDHVDTLAQQHWYMFTGSLEVEEARTVDNRGRASSILDQIKYGTSHIPRTSDSSDIEKWVSAYKSSLYDSAKAYIEIVKPHKHFTDAVEGSDSGEIIDLLYVIEQFMPSRQMSGRLGMHLALKSKQDRYKEILDALETLVVRSYQVPSLRNDLWRREFAKIGFDLSWTTMGEKRSEVFNDSYGLEYTISNLDDKLTDLLKDSGDVDLVDFRDRVGDSALIDGSHMPNWAGARDGQDFALYLLYRYEQDEFSSPASLSNYNYYELKEGENEDNYYATYEHVWPKERSSNEVPDWVSLDDEKQYEPLCQYIGNGLMLVREKNSSLGNKQYAKKRDTYLSNDVRMATSETLPTEEEGWTREKIESRSKKISNWAINYWSFDGESPEPDTIEWDMD